MLSSSLDTLLKVSITTSPQKLFAYDCVTLYNVMQSDRNSFNKTSRFEDNILDQYKSKYVRIINVMILILYNIIQKHIITLK